MTLKNSWKSLWGMRVPILIIGMVLVIISLCAHLTVSQRVMVWTPTAIIAALIMALFKHRDELERLEHAAADAPPILRSGRYTVSLRCKGRLEEAFQVLSKKGVVSLCPHILYGQVYIFNSDAQLQDLKKSDIPFSIVLEREENRPYNSKLVPMTYDDSKRKRP